MVKTRTSKRPNKVFEKDFVKASPGKVAKKHRKKPNILSPRSKRGLGSPSDATSSPDSSSPERKRTKHSTEEESGSGGRSGPLTIVFARKRSVLGGSSTQHQHHAKKSKSKKKSKHKEKVTEDEDPRSTSASFKRKGMDRESRPNSPTRGVDEIDRIRYALEEIKSGAATSVQKAACKWRIHADKLYRRLKGTVRIDGRNGPPPVLSRAEEDKLTTWIITMSERGFPVSSGSLRNTVQNFLKQDKRKNPFTDDKPSMSWYKAFVRRNPKVRTVSSMMLTRSCKSLEGALVAWYSELDTFLRCLDIIDKPDRIWYFVSIDLYAASSSSANGQSSSMEGPSSREKVCTCIVSANAAGHVIPPFFVFRGHCVPTSWDPLVGAPLSSGILYSQLGSASKTVYSDWLENHFLPNIGSERPTVLLLDCPEGHIDVDVFVTAQQNDIHMFRIIPAISDLVCPITEEMLKTPWEKEAALWNASHPLVPVSAKNAARIVGKAWPKIDQPAIIAHNFRKAGLFPVDSSVSKSLLKEKYRKDRENELVESICTLKPAQSLIDLELFESNLDLTLKEEYHRQLIARDTEKETDHFREWKHLYEAVYGKIIPVQDVPVAEEEVTVSYVEHIMDDSEVIEAGSYLEEQPVTVEIKEEYVPSQVVFSNDLSSVPRDVINVALTMATDIATYRTEGSKGGSSPRPNESSSSDRPNSTVTSTTAPLNIPAAVSDSMTVATSGAGVSSVSNPPKSTEGSSGAQALPRSTASVMTTRHQPVSQNNISSIVPPVPTSAATPTIVNVIRVTPGEKRDFTKSNIAVRQTPVTPARKPGKVGKKITASGLIQQVAKAASIRAPEEALPMIHISDTGEVSVVPQEETREEVVEVTDVIEVNDQSLRGMSGDQVVEQIQVSEMEVISDPPVATTIPGDGDSATVQQDNPVVVLGGDGVTATEEVVVSATPDIAPPQEMAMEVDVVSDTVTTSVIETVTDTVGATTFSGGDIGSDATPVTTDTPVIQPVGSSTEQMDIGTVQEGAESSEGKSKDQSAGVTPSTETLGGPGELPLVLGDAIIETEAVEVGGSESSDQLQREGAVTTTDSVNQGDPETTPAETDVGPQTMDKPGMLGGPGNDPLMQEDVLAAVVSEVVASEELRDDLMTGNGAVPVGTETGTTDRGDAPLMQDDVMGAVVSEAVASEELKGDPMTGNGAVPVGTEAGTTDGGDGPGDAPLMQDDVMEAVVSEAVASEELKGDPMTGNGAVPAGTETGTTDRGDGPGDAPLMQDDVIEAVDSGVVVGEGLGSDLATGNKDAPAATETATADRGEGPGDSPLMQDDVMEAVVNEVAVSGELESDLTTGNEDAPAATETGAANRGEGPEDTPLMRDDVMEAILSEVVVSGELAKDSTTGNQEVSAAAETGTAGEGEIPGDAPPIEGDVTTEEAVKEPKQSEGSEIVITVDDALEGEGQREASMPAPGTVEVIQRSTSSQDEMGEILAPSTEDSTMEAAGV